MTDEKKAAAEDPVPQELAAGFAKMHEAFLGELAAIHDAQARVSANAEKRLGRYLDEYSPRIQALRSAATEAKEMARALDAAAEKRRAGLADSPADADRPRSRPIRAPASRSPRKRSSKSGR